MVPPASWILTLRYTYIRSYLAESYTISTPMNWSCFTEMVLPPWMRATRKSSLRACATSLNALRLPVLESTSTYPKL